MCDSGISSSSPLCIAQQNIMDRFEREWDTAYWAPVKNSKPPQEKYWEMQSCKWSKERNKLMQTWHITKKRLVGSGCSNDVFDGTDVEVCDHEGGCTYSNDGNDKDSAHGNDQDVAQDDKHGADGKCKDSNVDADSKNKASADGKAEDSKDDDGTDKKAANGKDKSTNLDAVDSMMIDKDKDGNVHAHGRDKGIDIAALNAKRVEKGVQQWAEDAAKMLQKPHQTASLGFQWNCGSSGIRHTSFGYGTHCTCCGCHTRGLLLSSPPRGKDSETDADGNDTSSKVKINANRKDKDAAEDDKHGKCKDSSADLGGKNEDSADDKDDDVVSNVDSMILVEQPLTFEDL